MNHTDVLELLVDHYASAPTPAPSAELLARINAGGMGVADERDRGAVVVPFASRPQLRVRYLVAAMVATFVVFSGLAVAGALPDSIQRGVASVVSHVGIDLPEPEAPTPRPAHGDDSGTPHVSTPGASTLGQGSSGDASTGSARGGANGSTPTSSTTAGDPSVLGDPTVPTTLPSTTLAPDGGLLPPLNLPELTLPPLSIPQLTLPPLTIPQLTLPPLTIPQLTLPPLNLPPLLPLDLPGL